MKLHRTHHDRTQLRELKTRKTCFATLSTPRSSGSPPGAGASLRLAANQCLRLAQGDAEYEPVNGVAEARPFSANLRHRVLYVAGHVVHHGTDLVVSAEPVIRHRREHLRG